MPFLQPTTISIADMNEQSIDLKLDVNKVVNKHLNLGHTITANQILFISIKLISILFIVEIIFHKFWTPYELLKWVQDEVVKFRFVILITKLNHGNGRKKITLILGCERGGKYIRNTIISWSKKDTRFIKCEYTFRW